MVIWFVTLWDTDMSEDRAVSIFSVVWGLEVDIIDIELGVWVGGGGALSPVQDKRRVGENIPFQGHYYEYMSR